eukprot:CAMPEP_0181396990 /NCGR_PEP_ID=MMETSP1110-20121109/225_1 /TAXON_ID=174948 /ORGANISM="Symbiodinium sp., Strain CCMP421" /LENGTH=171 /DNA_ID=CAMNT_0023518757 /DNA_START=60 /DNA_END=576 /DNA_ORIENTATION=-
MTLTSAPTSPPDSSPSLSVSGLGALTAVHFAGFQIGLGQVDSVAVIHQDGCLSRRCRAAFGLAGQKLPPRRGATQPLRPRALGQRTQLWLTADLGGLLQGGGDASKAFQLQPNAAAGHLPALAGHVPRVLGGELQVLFAWLVEDLGLQVSQDSQRSSSERSRERCGTSSSP